MGREMATGSGFFAGRAGYVVTNAHVITYVRQKLRLAEKIEVVVASGTSDQQTISARVVGYDQVQDLALLKVTGDALPVPLQFGQADHLNETEDAYLFGFPLGELLGKNVSVNKTTISNIRKDAGRVTRVEFAGGSFFGSSGGPVTNTTGEVVGVCQGAIRGSQINFAIPAETASAFFDEQIRTGGVRKHAPAADRPDRAGPSRGADGKPRGRKVRRRPAVDTATAGLFPSVPTWVLATGWVVMIALSAVVLLVIGDKYPGLQRFIGIMSVAFSSPVFSEVFRRCVGWTRYDPEGVLARGPAPLRLRTAEELATMPPLDPEDDPRLDDGPVEGPPQEEFWEAYNRRLEFPLSAVGTVLLHVLLAALFVYALTRLMNDDDRSGPPLKLMQVGGLDDAGDGSPGSGGRDTEVERDVNAAGLKETFATPEALKQAQENIKKLALDDPSKDLAVSPTNAAAFEQLNQALKEKLLGGRQGAGNQPGKGPDGAGSGVGGTGADSTRARGLRWVLRFSVRGGADYIGQLRAMGAEILIPLSSDKDCIIIPDLSNPQSARTATDEDFRRLAGKIQFSDNRRAMVKEVTDTLSVTVPGQPKAFWAFFPKAVEDELASKEKAHRGRRPEDIEETVFRVTTRGGSFEMVVEEQTSKR
jgi:hypothetical protein